jgi:hypothetical protein
MNILQLEILHLSGYLEDIDVNGRQYYKNSDMKMRIRFLELRMGSNDGVPHQSERVRKT